MEAFSIRIDNMGGAAFADEDDPTQGAAEIARILREVADRLDAGWGHCPSVVRDHNGNAVGTVETTK